MARWQTQFGRLSWLWLIVALFMVPTALAQDDAPTDPVTYLRYDSEITILPTGDFVVREEQTIYFNGQFSFAFADIPRALTTDISAIQVYEGDTPLTQVASVDQPGTFSVTDDANQINVEWSYAPTAPGSTRTFVVEYLVEGGLWVYPNETRLEWRAVPADRSGVAVRDSRVTIKLPPGVLANDLLETTTFGTDTSITPLGSQLLITANEPLPDGERLQVLVALPPGSVTAEPQDWQVAEDQAELAYTFDSLHVDMTIAADGAVNVVEYQTVTVTDGALYEGYRRLPLLFVDDIELAGVYEGDQAYSDAATCAAYCYEASVEAQFGEPFSIRQSDYQVAIDPDRADVFELRWSFPPLYRGETTTFELEYRPIGLIQTDDTAQQLAWTVAFAERTVPVTNASIWIQLPPGVTAADVTVDDEPVAPVPGTTDQIELSADGQILAGKSWAVRLTMPPDATSAAKPSWQARFEAIRAEATAAAVAAAEAEQAAAAAVARQQLIAGGAGAALLFGGLAGTLTLWYRRGRDLPIVGSYDFFAKPPSDLPPGIVAYLVDERPTTKGVLSALFDLATLGLLRIDLTDTLRLQRNGSLAPTYGQVIEIEGRPPMAIPDHLVTLYTRLRDHIPLETPVGLEQIAEPFRQALPDVYAEMAEEADQYFTSRPDAARRRWLVTGQWLVLLAAVATFCGLIYYVPTLGAVALAPTLALGVVGFALMIISRWMAQRTASGAEEEARWQAFRRYLRDMQKRADLAEAQTILDDYFAYAVALDVEDVVLKQVEALGGKRPYWMYPTRNGWGAPLGPNRPIRRRTARRAAEPDVNRPIQVQRWGAPGQGGSLGGQRAPLRLPDRDDVSLEALSSRLTRSLNDATRGLTQVLNTAVGDTQKDTPFRVVLKGSGQALALSWKATTGTVKVLGDIVDAMASSSGGSGGYRGSSSNWSSSSRRSSGRTSSASRSRSTRSRSRSSSSRSSGRSSSSRRSGGGGSRGFR